MVLQEPILAAGHRGLPLYRSGGTWYNVFDTNHKKQQLCRIETHTAANRAGCVRRGRTYERNEDDRAAGPAGQRISFRLRPGSEGLTRREYLDCSLRAIASMQVEPETVYCEEGTALQDELDLDHLEDGMHADGTWLYYGKPDEGFFFLLWFEDEGEAMTKQAQLSADPAVCCWLVDLEKDITTVE